MVKKVGKYEIGKTLGEGTFGKVKYALNTETNEAVAIKILDKEKIQKQNMGAQIKKEISIMKMVRHKHVVQLREVLASRTKIFIVLDIITGGELFDKIVSEGRLKEDDARKYYRQLLDGLHYCHKNGVCHRDLKPENLLLDERGNLKISDFGLSALYEGGEGASREELLHTTCGTPNYVAPEVLADKGYDGRTADVWSSGVILYVLLAGFLPFDESTMAALFQKIQAAEFSYPSWFSPEVRSLLDNILVVDPTARFTVDQVKQHSWVTKGGTLPDESSEEPLPSPPEAMQGDFEGAVTENVVEEAGTAEDTAEDGPKRLNAFELINQCEGLALSRMFQSSQERQTKRAYQFTSNKPVAELLEGLGTALRDAQCEMKIFDQNAKIKATTVTNSGMIGIVIQVFGLTSNMRLVEIRRGKGDALEYHRFFRELVTTRLRDTLNIPESQEFLNVFNLLPRNEGQAT